MTASDGLAAVELQRGCDPHRRGFDNSEKATKSTETLCPPEVTTTPAMLAETRRGERESVVVAAGSASTASSSPHRPWNVADRLAGRGIAPGGFAL